MKRVVGIGATVLLALGGALLAQPRISFSFPLKGTPRINANFGAFGPGPASDPNTYFSGQYHLGVDLAATAGTEVASPVTGTLVYYHQLRNSPREVRLLDTFLVIRGSDGRDFILAHVACTICASDTPIGDEGSYPKQNWRSVKAGEIVGQIADLKSEAVRLKSSASIGNHLHLGVVEGQIIDGNGKLKPSYRGGNWSRLLYDTSEDGNPVTARSQAKENGFVDPLVILKGAPVATPKTPPVVAPAVLPSPVPPQVSRRPDLAIGAYVYHQYTCQQASNASLQWWNGQYFSAGRMTNVYPTFVAPGRFTAKVKDFETGQLMNVNVQVQNQHEYTMDGARMRFCPDPALPAMWRNSTPKPVAQSTGGSSSSIGATNQKLTSIAGAPITGCTLSFDLQRRQIFAHTWTDGWRVGIGGITNYFRQSDSRYDNSTGAYTLFSRDRRTTVRTQPTGKSVSTRSYDADIVDVTLAANGTTFQTKAYRICPAGD